MRAIDLVVALTCLNAGFYIIDAIGVYGAVAPTGRILSVSGTLAVAALGAAIFAASVTLVGSSVARPIGVVAVAFTGFYTFFVVNAMMILDEIKIGGTGIHPAIILAFGGLNTIIFAIAMIQLVSGGARGAR